MAKKGTKSLQRPVVKQTDLEAAREMLANEAEMKRARSQMSYWLRNQGFEKEYSTKNTTAKRDFLQHWFADRLAQKNAAKAATSSQRYSSTESAEHKYQWLGKQQMINMFGEAKALAKINSSKLKTRPDPDSGLDDEWNREYQVFVDSGGDTETNSKDEILEAKEEGLSDEQVKEKLEFMRDATECMTSGGQSSATPGVVIKKENGGMAAIAQPMPHAETVAKLQADIKKEMRAMADKLTTLKEIFTQTKEQKYLQELNSDTSKLIPKASSMVTQIERAHLEQEKDEATLLVIAKNIDGFVDKYNEMLDWYQKLAPKRSTKKAKTG